LCKKHGIDSIKWAIYGIPENISVDNAKEFLSRDFINECKRLNINVIHRQKHKPLYRNLIERYLNRIDTKIFKHSKTKKVTHLTLNNFEGILCRYFADIYLDEFQSVIDTTPRKKWLAGLKIRMPSNVVLKSELLSLLTVKEPRLVHCSGLVFNGIGYWDNKLTDLIGDRVNFRYDPKSLSRIYIENPRTMYYFAAEAKEPYKEIAKHSIWEIRAYRKEIISKIHLL